MKRIFDGTELVAVRVGAALFRGLYSPPRANWSGLRDALSAFAALAHGKAVLARDFNARHVQWCTRDNPRGKKLLQWEESNRWRIDAPRDSTCRNSSGAQSTIDLILSKAGCVRRVHARLEWHETFRSSNHAPVLFEWWGRATALRPNDRRIPMGRRPEEKVLDEAETWLDAEMPAHIAATRAVRTQRELDAAYNRAVQCVLRPWNQVRAKDRPLSWGPHWTRELQELAKRRRSSWRRWKRTGEDEAKAEHKRLNRLIKHKVRQNKRRGFKEFSRDQCSMQPNKAVGIMSRMIKVKRRNKLANSPSSRRIEPQQFTEFVAQQHTRRQGERRLQCRRFMVDEDLRTDIEQAVRRAPRKKATGEDEIFAEAMRVRPALVAEWIFEVW